VGITPMMIPKFLFFVRKPTDTQPGFEPLFHTQGIQEESTFTLAKTGCGSKGIPQYVLVEDICIKEAFPFQKQSWIV
jgi:hypothetical protein